MAGFRLKTGLRGFDVARARFLKATRTVKGKQLLAVQKAAQLAEREIKKGLKSGAPGGQKFKELSPITKLLRRGTKPLITAQASLFGSITTTVDKRKVAAFVGVHRTAKADDGTSIVNVALIHEFGVDPYPIIVDPDPRAPIRRFFWFLHFKSGGTINPLSPATTLIIHPGIPARPFIRPTIKAIRPRLQAVVVKTMGQGGVI